MRHHHAAQAVSVAVKIFKFSLSALPEHAADPSKPFQRPQCTFRSQFCGIGNAFESPDADRGKPRSLSWIVCVYQNLLNSASVFGFSRRGLHSWISPPFSTWNSAWISIFSLFSPGGQQSISRSVVWSSCCLGEPNRYGCLLTIPLDG